MGSSSVVAVVLNYKRPTDTIECVKSLQKSSWQDLRIVVVDNASPDDSVARIRAAYPDIDLIQSPSNAGYAGGMNFGIRHALKSDPDYLLLINSDTMVDSRFVELLVQALDTHNDAGAASGTIYRYPATDEIWYAGGDVQYWRASAFTKLHFPVPGSDPDTAIPVTFLSGCGLLIRTKALEQVGVFDERFFMYVEDTDLCVRFARKGFSLMYVPRATMYHKVGTEHVLPFPLYYSVRNRLLFMRSAPNVAMKIAGYSYLSVVLILKSLVWSIVRPDLAAAIRLSVRDFLSGRFYEGSGFDLRDSIGSTRRRTEGS